MFLNSSVPLQLNHTCFTVTIGGFIFTAFTVTNFLLVFPPCLLILYMGLQQWRDGRSTSMSPSDIIAHHMAAMAIFNVAGSVFYCLGLYAEVFWMLNVSSHVFFISLCGEMSLHTLTCMERYLAVVHPVTFMHLRKGSGVRDRNILMGLIWLLAVVEMLNVALGQIDTIIMVYLAQQGFSLAAVSFCSLAVLRVLKRPGPGEGGRQQVDQSKQKAFNTITAILGTLFFRFGGTMVCTALYASLDWPVSNRCLVIELSFWFSLPSNLVLPLLFLHKAGKLPVCF